MKFRDLIKESNKYVIEKNTKFTPVQLKKLKDEYSKIKKIDPSSKTYEQLNDYMDTLSYIQLKQIKDAEIPFLRSMANIRLMKKEETFYEEDFFVEGNIIKTLKDLTNKLVGKKVKFKIKGRNSGKGIGNIKDIEEPSSFRKILKIITPDGDEKWFTLDGRTQFGLQLV